MWFLLTVALAVEPFTLKPLPEDGTRVSTGWDKTYAVCEQSVHGQLEMWRTDGSVCYARTSWMFSEYDDTQGLRLTADPTRYKLRTDAGESEPFGETLVQSRYVADCWQSNRVDDQIWSVTFEACVPAAGWFSSETRRIEKILTLPEQVTVDPAVAALLSANAVPINPLRKAQHKAAERRMADIQARNEEAARAQLEAQVVEAILFE